MPTEVFDTNRAWDASYVAGYNARNPGKGTSSSSGSSSSNTISPSNWGANTTFSQWLANGPTLRGYTPAMTNAIWGNLNTQHNAAVNAYNSATPWIGKDRRDTNGNILHLPQESRMSYGQLSAALADWYSNQPDPSNQASRYLTSADDPFAGLSASSYPTLSLKQYTGQTGVDSPQHPNWEAYNASVLNPAQQTLMQQTVPQLVGQLSGGAYGSARDSGIGQNLVASAANQFGQSAIQARGQEVARVQQQKLANDIANLQNAINVHYKNQGLTTEEYNAKAQAANYALQVAQAEWGRSVNIAASLPNYDNTDLIQQAGQFTSQLNAQQQAADASKFSWNNLIPLGLDAIGSAFGLPPGIASSTYSLASGNANAMQVLSPFVSNYVGNKLGNWWNSGTNTGIGTASNIPASSYGLQNTGNIGSAYSGYDPTGLSQYTNSALNNPIMNNALVNSPTYFDRSSLYLPKSTASRTNSLYDFSN